jgi:hypothetical protein
MTRVFVKGLVGVCVGLALGCGGSEQEGVGEDGLGIGTAALSATQSNVTAGECTATVSLERSGTSLASTCSDSCKRDGAVTLRLYIEKPNSAGVWDYVSFGYTGHAARKGGSATTTAANQPAGTYRARCNVDYVDSKQIHTLADVIVGPGSF